MLGIKSIIVYIYICIYIYMYIYIYIFENQDKNLRWWSYRLSWQRDA